MGNDEYIQLESHYLSTKCDAEYLYILSEPCFENAAEVVTNIFNWNLINTEHNVHC
jgi:hypothetical protein